MADLGSGTTEDANAIADAIIQGGEEAVHTYAVACAQASANGGDEAAALTQAISILSCQGGAGAEAFAETLSVAIETHPRVCAILSKARAIAYAKCGQNGVFATASTEVTKTVIGLCGLSAGYAGSSVRGL